MLCTANFIAELNQIADQYFQDVSNDACALLGRHALFAKIKKTFESAGYGELYISELHIVYKEIYGDVYEGRKALLTSSFLEWARMSSGSAPEMEVDYPVYAYSREKKLGVCLFQILQDTKKISVHVETLIEKKIKERLSWILYIPEKNYRVDYLTKRLMRLLKFEYGCSPQLVVEMERFFLEYYVGTMQLGKHQYSPSIQGNLFVEFAKCKNSVVELFKHGNEKFRPSLSIINKKTKWSEAACSALIDMINFAIFNEITLSGPNLTEAAESEIMIEHPHPVEYAKQLAQAVENSPNHLIFSANIKDWISATNASYDNHKIRDVLAGKTLNIHWPDSQILVEKLLKKKVVTDEIFQRNPSSFPTIKALLALNPEQRVNLLACEPYLKKIAPQVSESDRKSLNSPTLEIYVKMHEYINARFSWRYHKNIVTAVLFEPNATLETIRKKLKFYCDNPDNEVSSDSGFGKIIKLLGVDLQVNHLNFMQLTDAERVEALKSDKTALSLAINLSSKDAAKISHPRFQAYREIVKNERFLGKSRLLEAASITELYQSLCSHSESESKIKSLLAPVVMNDLLDMEKNTREANWAKYPKLKSKLAQDLTAEQCKAFQDVELTFFNDIDREYCHVYLITSYPAIRRAYSECNGSLEDFYQKLWERKEQLGPLDAADSISKIFIKIEKIFQVRVEPSPSSSSSSSSSMDELNDAIKLGCFYSIFNFTKHKKAEELLKLLAKQKDESNFNHFLVAILPGIKYKDVAALLSLDKDTRNLLFAKPNFIRDFMHALAVDTRFEADKLHTVECELKKLKSIDFLAWFYIEKGENRAHNGAVINDGCSYNRHLSLRTLDHSRLLHKDFLQDAIPYIFDFNELNELNRDRYYLQRLMALDDPEREQFLQDQSNSKTLAEKLCRHLQFYSAGDSAINQTISEIITSNNPAMTSQKLKLLVFIESKKYDFTSERDSLQWLINTILGRDENCEKEILLDADEILQDEFQPVLALSPLRPGTVTSTITVNPVPRPEVDESTTFSL